MYVCHIFSLAHVPLYSPLSVSGDGDVLRVLIMDEDRLKDDLVGGVDIDLAPFYKEHRQQPKSHDRTQSTHSQVRNPSLATHSAPVWFDVTLMGSNRKTGAVLLQISFLDPTAIVSDTPTTRLQDTTSFRTRSTATFGNTSNRVFNANTNASIGYAPTNPNSSQNLTASRSVSAGLAEVRGGGNANRVVNGSSASVNVNISYASAVGVNANANASTLKRPNKPIPQDLPSYTGQGLSAASTVRSVSVAQIASVVSLTSKAGPSINNYASSPSLGSNVPISGSNSVALNANTMHFANATSRVAPSNERDSASVVSTSTNLGVTHVTRALAK